ncbi:hypothetical protein B5V02_00530 [Mesorhizobium kowhaii]|uniref:Uncharacterized protein n=1 Tax=Mesorhizobium kowhaii TaxID=1300272 RepID=A0A2W7CDV3_9HYPH|nr:hypothetical protein B5V02_00530 [Mesorhizobium kowhaii]
MASFQHPGFRDSELTERPGRGWTRWAEGVGEYEIAGVWWQAMVLHFPNLNTSAWFDGSELVGLALGDFASRSGVCASRRPIGNLCQRVIGKPQSAPGRSGVQSISRQSRALATLLT